MFPLVPASVSLQAIPIKEILNYVINNVVSFERDQPARWRSGWPGRIAAERHTVSRPSGDCPADLEFSLDARGIPIPRWVSAAGPGSPRHVSAPGDTHRGLGTRRLHPDPGWRAGGGHTGWSHPSRLN